MTYRVVVTRERGAWLADVPDLPGAHTWARDLAKLDGYVREVIALMAGLPDGAEADVDIAWDYRTGDDEVDREAADLRDERRLLTSKTAEVARRTQVAAAGLAAKGWSVRDIAGLLGVSPQRISQVAPRAKAKPKPAAKKAAAARRARA